MNIKKLYVVIRQDSVTQWYNGLRLQMHCAAGIRTCLQVLNVNNIKANPLPYESPCIKCFLFILVNVAIVSV